MIRPVLLFFAFAPAAPLVACQQGGQTGNREEQTMKVGSRDAARQFRTVQTVFADFERTNARLLIDGETVFEGPLDVQQRSTGISRLIEMRIAIGRRIFRLTSGSLDVTIPIDIGHETQTVVINPHYTPYIQALNGPSMLD
jgi:hypothetical protein